MDYQFDHAGRRIHARSPDIGLKDAQDRLSSHTFDCKRCLRHVAGYGTVRCGVGEQILGQIAVFKRALEHAKG